MKCTCFQGPWGLVGVCRWGLLVELSSAFCLPPASRHHLGLFSWRPWPGTGRTLSPFPCRLLILTSLGSDGGGLSRHAYSSRGMGDHKYLLNEREAFWGGTFLVRLPTHMSHEMTRAFPCSRKCHVPVKIIHRPLDSPCGAGPVTFSSSPLITFRNLPLPEPGGCSSDPFMGWSPPGQNSPQCPTGRQLWVGRVQVD